MLLSAAKSIYVNVKDVVFIRARSNVIVDVSVYEEQLNVTVVIFRVDVKDHVNCFTMTIIKQLFKMFYRDLLYTLIIMYC